MTTPRPSSPGEFHPEALTEPCLTVSGHTARAIHGERPPPVMNGRFLPLPVDQVDHDPNGPPPSLREHYTRIIATPRQSAPRRRIGTFGLAVVAACAFSLSIAGKVLTFRTRAWLSFAPSTCRMPLGQASGFSRADPGGRVTLRF